MATRKPVAHELPERLGEVEALDGPARAVAKVVRDVIPSGPVKDALSGTWLGHALHPLLTDIPIGTWTSAVLLDWLGGEDHEAAADRLISTGLLAAAPTAVSGFSDWTDTTMSSASVRRVGLVHAASNVAAVGLFAASRLARARGDRGRGRALALGGMGTLVVGGHLGGHLSYSHAVGVDNTAFDRFPKEWTRVLEEAELREGEPRRVDAGGAPVMVVRDGGAIHALAHRCSHRGGPLADGEISDGCVTCPWHGSRFRLEDGSVERGPAAYPQPRLETRVIDGSIEVRAPGGS
jgi:nitrite reductase/ring-hydroxylating ferredoxin subunit/uncharacterized membrane protein